MAFDTTNGTKLANLVNPQVMAGLINNKLTDLQRLTPLCTIDSTLVGQPGSVITIPKFAYIGDAADVAEGADMGISKLTETTTNATIKKVGKAVELTEEALLSAYGDPLNQAAYQIALAISAKMDNDVLATANGATLTYTSAATEFTADDFADALVKFGEGIDGDKYAVVSPATYAALRKADDWCPASEIAADMVIKGAVGMIHGCQVVLTNKLSGSTYGKGAFIVKPGALRIYEKRNTIIKTDEDIIGSFLVVAATRHYVTHLYDASKIIKMTHA